MTNLRGPVRPPDGLTLLRRARLLGRLRSRLLLLAAVGPVVLALELLDAAGRVHVLHLAGEERVTGRADLDRDVLLRAARLELVAAAAGDGGFFVLRVDAVFHGVVSSLNWRVYFRKRFSPGARAEGATMPSRKRLGREPRGL